MNQERSSEREGDGIMNNKNKSLADKIPKRVWLLISFAVAMLFWYILSIIPSTSRAFQNVVVVCQSIKTMIDRGVLGTDILSSLISVVAGYVLGFVIALPVAILMAWYKPVRYIIEPWIQFIRNIPPLAYVPLIVMHIVKKHAIVITMICVFLPTPAAMWAELDSLPVVEKTAPAEEFSTVKEQTVENEIGRASCRERV